MSSLPAPPPPCPRDRWVLLPLLILLLCVPLLSGYVVPPHKVLQRWCHDRVFPNVVRPAVLPVRVQGRPGELYLGRPGTSALAVDGVLWASDPGLDDWGGRGALWRAMDLLLQSDSDTAADVLTTAGMALERAGYARDACSSDGVVHTLGARGEGEPDLPQVWFARSPLRLCRLRLAGSEVRLGPPGANGWPGWFRLDSGELLEITGAASPALVQPGWVAPRFPMFPPAGPDPVPDWRPAFGVPEP